MARRRKRHLGSTVEVALGGLPFMSDSVQMMDLVVGIGAALVGSALVKGLFKKALDPATYAKLATNIGAGMPLLASSVVSAGLYYGMKGKNQSKATGYAAGAAVTGLVLTGWDLARTNLQKLSPEYLDFSEVVSVNMGGYSGLGNYGGVLIADHSDGLNGFGGVLIADKSDGLNELAAMSMAPDDDGLAALSMFR